MGSAWACSKRYPILHTVPVGCASPSRGTTAAATEVSHREKSHLLGSPEAAPTFEYRVLSPSTISDLEHQLNDLGAQGFDVVGVATAFKQAQGREVPFIVLKRTRHR